MKLAPLLVATALNAAAALVTIDASRPPSAPEALAMGFGAQRPAGAPQYGADSRSLLVDGKPWFPVMGEFHYSRYPAAEWAGELARMKAGGINTVATYVFWLHHEERQDRFDWSGQRNLRAFVEQAREAGLAVWIRIGPWSHGEARNGGFPDWLLKLGPTRTNAPAYLERVERFYGEIGRQLQGLFWKDGGPIIGIQVENEYHPVSGGIEHMQRLRELAVKAGMDAPYWTATAWDRAVVPPGFLPVFGGYVDNFWSASIQELEPSQHYFFTRIRAEDNVMGDLTPKVAEYNAKYEGFPFLTAEMGGGMTIAYHRRPLMGADDCAAAALVKLGSGISGLGYYMYHGGTNPDAEGPMQETLSAWNGYNEMEAKSYDFQAPLGEFGREHPSYRPMKLIHQFLQAFGDRLAPMDTWFPQVQPKGRGDRATPRVALRGDGSSGFVFINNFQRGTPLPDQREFQVAIQRAGERLLVPRTPLTIPSGAYMHWSLGLELGIARLEYATAQLVTRLADPSVLVFTTWPGVPVEFCFAAKRGLKVDAAEGANVTVSGGRIYVDGLQPGLDASLRLSTGAGDSMQILLLSREQALDLWTLDLGGRPRLILSKAGLRQDHRGLRMIADDPADLACAIFPAVNSVPAGFGEEDAQGIFQICASTRQPQRKPVSIELSQLRKATPATPVRMGPEKRRVALAPEEADWEGAAAWRLRIAKPAEVLRGRNFLRIAYDGDAARILAGGRLINDNFQRGAPWELGLWRFTAEDLERGLELRILPLRADAPVYIQREFRPRFQAGATEVLRLRGISIEAEHEVLLPDTR